MSHRGRKLRRRQLGGLKVRFGCEQPPRLRQAKKTPTTPCFFCDQNFNVMMTMRDWCAFAVLLAVVCGMLANDALLFGDSKTLSPFVSQETKKPKKKNPKKQKTQHQPRDLQTAARLAG
jgi:hypothetical protein